jgi:membrane peptidoglycan carboxypeptidase
MLEEKMIDQAQYDEAIATPVNETTVIISEPKNGCLYATAAKFFCDYVLRNVPNLEALGATPEERKANFALGGYDIYTTIDLDQNNLAEQLLVAQTPPTETRFALGSAVSTIQVGTGRIVVMAQNKTYDNRDAAAGGGDPSTTSVNYNTDANYGGSSGFQPGSAYKLFTLIDWLEKGHGLNEQVDGNQKTYTPSMLKAKCAPNGSNYAVKNDGGGNRGRLSVSAATAGSVNAAFYSMASKLDLCDIRDAATRMGVARADGDPLNTFPSIVLGTDEVSPLSMANAYATVANNGVLCTPIAVDRVVTAEGEELPGQTSTCEQVIGPEIAHAAGKALQGVMRGGTGAASNPNDGTPLIGKTGTADAFHTWILSASTKVSSAVWVGNISGQQSLRRISVAGGQAATARHRIMKPLQAALDQGIGAGATAFPEPPRSLVNGTGQAVPQLAGQTQDAAKKLVESLGFDFAVGATVASEVPAGRVVSSDPGGGALVSKGSLITVTVSDGSLAVTMPNVVGQRFDQAAGTLGGSGFDVGKVAINYVASDPKETCTVTGSNPAAGAATSKAASITLTVNGGELVPGRDPDCS